MSVQPFKSENAFKQRLDFHLFSATVWGALAKDAMPVLTKETYLPHRVQYEAFIERALARALQHYRRADAVRKRGFK